MPGIVTDGILASGVSLEFNDVIDEGGTAGIDDAGDGRALAFTDGVGIVDKLSGERKW